MSDIQESLAKQWNGLMKNFSFDDKYDEWEKEGENFKQFSIYDYSDYETHTVNTTANLPYENFELW